MKLHLLDLSGLHKQYAAQIPDVYEVQEADASTINKELVEWADVILGRVPRNLLVHARRLQLLQLDCAGSEQYVEEGLLSQECVLCNASGSFGLAISEYLLCTILMLMRNMNLYTRNQLHSLWKVEGPIQSIYHSTIIIAGTGDLGQEFAKRAKALGAYTIGIRQHVENQVAYFDELHTLSELIELLPQADVVVLALPSSKKTRRCFTKQHFAAMKSTAILANVGRGDVLYTEDLLEAVQTKQIYGAIVDVCDVEPLDDKHPLWKEENIIVTPHISGTFQLQESYARFAQIALYNLEAFAKGQELKNIVDRVEGYRIHTTE